MEKSFIDHLSSFVTERRMSLFEKILNDRTRYLTVVLEDIYQPHNASAVLRSCDVFGIQDVHIIENKNKYTVNPDVTLGSDKWLNITKYNAGENNTMEAINKIRSQGYRIIAASPHEKSVPLENFDLKKGKVALVFGTELRGLSEDVLNNSDEFVHIPMFGFTESLNISVSVAIILNNLSEKLRKLNINWQLSPKEKDLILRNWLMRSINKSELIEKKFNSENLTDIL